MSQSIHTNRSSARFASAALGALAFALFLLTFASQALAGPPIHPRLPALDINGLNHACGAAIDSKGDVYVASAGEAKVKVFNPAHTELTSIPNANEPCGLAVNGKGELFVSEQATGNVVRYKPNAYPLTGSPTYGAAEPIDTSGDAKGIFVDPHDDRLYVARGSHVAVYEGDGTFEATVGEGELSGVTGVAAYTYVTSKDNFGESGTRTLFIVEGAAGRAKVYSGAVQTCFAAICGAPAGSVLTNFAPAKLRKTINGVDHDRDSESPDQSFGFGPGGAYLAVDPGNVGKDGKCVSVAEQACTAGHFLVYDAAHDAVDEFDATGEFLDQLKDPAIADAKPTAMAIDRSGGAGDGTIYVSAGDASGAKLVAFGPLPAPSRPPLPGLSRELANASAVTVDSQGNVYVAAGTLIHIFSPTGAEIEVGPEGEGIEDLNNPRDLAVDSTGRVYVADVGDPEGGDEIATYYTPSAYPPVDGTDYSRHEPPLSTKLDFNAGVGNPPSGPAAVAVRPSNDHFLAIGEGKMIELDSAVNGSAFIRNFAPTLSFFTPTTDFCAASGSMEVSEQGNTPLVSVVDSDGTEKIARITGAGSPKGPFISSSLAVDDSNCHALVFNNAYGAAREYDAAGGFVAEFAFPEPQGFTTNLFGAYDIAIDNSGGPTDGNVYIAFDDTKPNTPDLWAFGPLTYGETPLAVTGIASGLEGGNATLNATVNPRAFDLSECRFEYLTDDKYVENGKTFAGATSVPCAESLGAIGKGSLPVPVHADVSGLEPDGRYRFRLVAQNKYGPNEGEAGLFGPPLVSAKPALPVLYDEATLRAEVNPSGLWTKYRFEYGAGESYGQSTPTGELAPGEKAVAIHADLTGLDEGSTYHFRVVAENETQTIEGPDQTLVTLARRPAESCPNPEFRTGLSANLPDCRAYELVTPAETNGFTPIAANNSGIGHPFDNWLVTPRGAAAGERLSYFTSGTLPGFDGNGFLDGYRAERATGEGPHPQKGWRSELFAPTYGQSVPNLTKIPPAQLGVASDQLYSFWRVEPADALPGALETGFYLRSPSGFEPVGQGALGIDLKAESTHLSSGGAHVTFFSKAHLEEDAPPVGTTAVYDRAAGEASAHVVSLLPGEVTPSAGEDASYVASSEDGSAIVFRLGGALYLRRNNAETVQIAAAPNTFAGISEDGERVFFVGADVWDIPMPEVGRNLLPGTLFACDAQAGSCAGPDKAQEPTEIAAESVFVNVSADGSHVFLTSKEALTGGQENEAGEIAEAGKRNLYAWDAGTEETRFIAQLDFQDFVSFDGDIGMYLDRWTAAMDRGSGRAASPTRSTPDGETLVFQSHAQLTAYDNDGKGEIYRYEAGAAPGEQLVCVSCDPSGADASADALLAGLKSGTDAATRVIANLTEDGDEVFFQSADRLLPDDANAVSDVYEWKAKGIGSCKREGGCLALISSGQGERDNVLYSVTPDGHDVFFRTREKLVGQDVPGSPSIYDARVGGGIPDPPEKAPCQGDSCQGSGSIPPVISSPASATIRSAGNTTGKEGKSCAKGRRKVRRGGETRCVKRQAKKRHHRKHRANHHRRASR